VYRKICTMGLTALAAAAAFELGACGANPDTVTVTMICSPGGLHIGLMTVAGASCPVTPPGSDVYYAAFAQGAPPDWPASAVAQLNTTPTTIKCTTKDKSRAGIVGASFNTAEQSRFGSWWTSSDITFTSDDEAVVCVLSNHVFAAHHPGAGLLLGGVWPAGTPVKTETLTCGPSGSFEGLLTLTGDLCTGGEPSPVRGSTKLGGWTAGEDDQLNSTTTTITCMTQDASGIVSGEYGGSSHANGSPDITFTNALGTVCVLTNPAIASLSFDPTQLLLHIGY
jgi:hypothetical protein